MNQKYGKLAEGEIVYAPNQLPMAGGIKVNPTESSYLEAGWKKIIDNPPEAESGKHIEPTGWREDEFTLTRVYEQKEGARGLAGPRTFSKLKMLLVLKRENLWVLTKTWIEEHGLYDFYLAAQFFTEDNEYFLQGKTELQKVMGKTDEEINALLDECVAD